MISDDGLIATCSHVIQGYDSQVQGEPKPEEVTIAFQATGQKAYARVVPEWWSPANCDDVAILKVAGGLPVGVKSLLLGSSEGTSGHPFQTFGFPDANPDEGIWGVGEILDKTKINGTEVLQIRSSQVNQGFSGAPVLDLAKNRVVGMVTAILVPDRNLRHTEDAFLTPTEALQSVCHLLKPSDIQPYIGLAAFTESQSEYFFGRRRSEDRILKSLKDEPRFLGVMGPSGCGKSSIVQAGLIPRLRIGALLGSERWHTVVVRPADDPFLNLESKGLKGTSDGLILSIKSILERYEKSRLLLVLDQFEEFLVTCPQKLRLDFWRQLEQLQEAEKLPVTIMVVMRDDFFGLFAQQAPPSLFEWVQKGFVHISSNLQEGELRDIIEEPAKKVGLRFEEGLAQAIIDDVIEAASEEGERASRSTVLPLLESALTQLWMRRDGGVMTHEAYNRIGRVTGSLTVWARETYEDLEEEGLGPLTRRIFLDLVHPGEEGKGVPDNRQRKLLKDLSRNDDEERLVHIVVDRLADARLVTTSIADETRRDTVVEIIHDSLIREWNLLQEWIKENRIFMAWQRKVHEDALDWKSPQVREKERLLAGTKLSEAEKWLHERGDDLNLVDREYISASVERRDQEKAEEERAMKEKEWAKRRTIQGLLIFSVIVLVLAVGMFYMWGQAEDQKLEALARYEYSVSNEIWDDPGKLIEGTLYAVQSLRHKQLMEGDLALRRCLGLLPKPVALMVYNNSVFSVAFSPDGSKVVTAIDDGTARTWDLSSGKELARMEHYSPINYITFRPINSITFSPDGSKIATASDDNTTRIWDVPSGKELARMEHNGNVNSVAFSPDGSKVATAGDDGTSRVWDALTGEELARMVHYSTINSITFSPDGSKVATATGDIAIIWDALTGEELVWMEHNDMVNFVIFSPDGSKVATASFDDTARVWDASTGKELARMEHNDTVSYVVFSPDGSKVATASDDGTARIWDALTGEELARMEHDGSVVSVAFSSDGSKVATVSLEKNFVRAILIPARKGTIRFQHYGPVNSIAFSPDDSKVATIIYDDIVMIWDALTGKELARMKHNGNVNSVDFTSDGSKVTTANWANMARIWDVSSGKELARMAHNGNVNSIAFSPDGSKVATASDDGTARIWDALTGEELARMEHYGPVNYITFSPDGSKIATANGFSARIISLKADDLICEACSRLKYNLTTDEWMKQYCSECQS